MKTICLNMIVKNESKIITRLFDSVIKLIDSYCICDTGSTDNTIQLIQDYFAERNIPGKVIQEPFRDFGYNRTFSLKACQGLSDYVLLLDADMVLQINSNLDIPGFKMMLKDDGYHIFQGNDNFYYKNVRIVKNTGTIDYWGVTHEYVRFYENAQITKIDKEILFILDVGDGGAKADKFERDIALLHRGLVDSPNNARYTFYLANSYHDIGDYDNAIHYYTKRSELGEWFEEVWFSFYRIGICYKAKGDIPKAIHFWMKAYESYPNRIENLYEIIQYYRLNNQNKTAYAYYLIAEQCLKKWSHTDYLFMRKDVYEYLLNYELTIIAYYIQDIIQDANHNFQNITKYSMKVLNYDNDSIVRSTLSNYKFYTPVLTLSHDYTIHSLTKCGVADGFVSSTPSLCLNHLGELVVNDRYVNYKIDDRGHYINQATISTINVITIIDVASMTLKNQSTLKYDTSLDGHYEGIEDVRLFSHSDGTLYYNGNRGVNGGIYVEHGTICDGTTNSGLLKKSGQHSVEKNWVLFEDGDQNLKCIYKWYPLTVGSINASYDYTVEQEIAMPTVFKHVRGSTNGVQRGNEIWFLCHVVSHEDRRYYYHMFVVLDRTTFALKKYTRLFTFAKEKVEYSLGFIFRENELLIGYSIMDRETRFAHIHKSNIEALFVY
jgi:tetratricopeptide (TPR) repeat protein